MNVRPLSDRLIVQRLEEGEQQVGGIIIPDTAKERPQQGKVIAAGHGKAGECLVVAALRPDHELWIHPAPQVEPRWTALYRV